LAADTQACLVVPVVKSADTKGVLAIAREISELTKQSRDGKLKPAHTPVGCMSYPCLAASEEPARP
jgi:pyruvate dehydrogenase E2 component (dihydrolipoamide acetyltransferase)